MPNGELRHIKSLKKKKIIQTEKDKKLLKEGSAKLSDFFNKR